jgi:drug/metabolite transporter (DMT)-like permease
MKKIILILPLISGILWGSVGVFVRKLYSFGFDNFTVLSSRIAIATLILFLGIMIFDKSLLKIKLKDAWVFLAAGLLGMLGLNLAYNESISRLTLSLAAVLLSLAPIFVVLWGAILFKERITVRKVGCMFMAIFGCLLTSGILESTASVKWSFVGYCVF